MVIYFTINIKDAGGSGKSPVAGASGQDSGRDKLRKQILDVEVAAIKKRVENDKKVFDREKEAQQRIRDMTAGSLSRQREQTIMQEVYKQRPDMGPTKLSKATSRRGGRAGQAMW